METISAETIVQPVNNKDVTKKPLTLSALFRCGSCIFLKCSIWSATTKINSNDLGIETTQDVLDALNLGSEKLLPKELMAPLTNLRSAATQLIKDYSAEFSFIPGSRFVPASNVPGLETLLGGLQKSFYLGVDKLVNNYEPAQVSQQEVINRALTNAVKDKPARSEIVTTAMLRIASKYPTVDELRKKFRFTWVRAGVNLPKDKTLDVIDKVETESQVVEETLHDIIKDYTAQVMELTLHVKEMAQKGSKPTTATVNSIKAIRTKVAAMTGIGGDSLLKCLDNLDILVQSSIEMLKAKQDATEVAAKMADAAAALVNNVEDAGNESFAAAIENLSLMADVVI